MNQIMQFFKSNKNTSQKMQTCFEYPEVLKHFIIQIWDLGKAVKVFWMLTFVA